MTALVILAIAAAVAAVAVYIPARILSAIVVRVVAFLIDERSGR